MKDRFLLIIGVIGCLVLFAVTLPVYVLAGDVNGANQWHDHWFELYRDWRNGTL